MKRVVLTSLKLFSKFNETVRKRNKKPDLVFSDFFEKVLPHAKYDEFTVS